MILGIDASNIRAGGGVTHMVELLRAAEPEKYGFGKVVVWSGRNTLAKLDDKPWLIKNNPPELNKGLIRRTLWQKQKLPRAARSAQCDLVFVPGGGTPGHFRPFVTMSRNLLPFETREFIRYGFSWMTLRNFVLRITQSLSFRRADGVIFLSEYAKNAVLKVAGNINCNTVTIPHGLSPRFIMKPKEQFSISEYNADNPYRLLYVSIVDTYKHQCHVARAVADLRTKGLPLALHLVGPAYPPSLKRLRTTIAQVDPDGKWLKYHGAVPYTELDRHYADADLGIFASSCENMPNILLETMAAGLPVASSNKGPMAEVLGNAGVYFDPESPDEIADALLQMINSSELRAELSERSFKRAQGFSWEKCANQTFDFLKMITG
jgi:glycosyltransferase involved in cell wall biosynthesis